MEDIRGRFYSEGYCIVSQEECKNYLKGACGTCKLGEAYLNQIESLKDQSELSKILCETI